MIKYAPLIVISFMMLSCAHSKKYNVSEIEQGKWLQHAEKSHTGQYFAVFSIDNLNKKKYWKILYKDKENVYFGFVKPQNIFSKQEVVEFSFNKIALDELEKNIPFYETDNLNRLLTDKIVGYETGLWHHNLKITRGRIILKNKVVLYQIEVAFYWYHFELEERQTNVLIIMDKDLTILDIFYLY